MLVINMFLYLLAFVFIWYGSGLIVTSASKFSKKLRISSFAFSFVILGILTSTPELSVGLQAVVNNDPEIFVGNLLGGIAVLFLVVIPLLAIFGNGISLKHELDDKTLLATIGVILTPSLLILDRRVTNLEGLAMVLLYMVLLFVVERKHGIFDKENSQLLNIKAYSYKDILKILVGLLIVFLASKTIVGQTMYFAGLLGISAFYISLIVVALGTDLPELTLAIRSVVSSKKDVAMGDYIGAAAASTLLFGMLTILQDGEVLTESNFLLTFLFIGTGLGLFYIFSKTKKFISRRDGVVMLAIYVLFVTLELLS